MKSLLILNSHVLLPEGNLQSLDVLIEGGKISQIGERLKMRADRVIDGIELTLLPGVIDPQVHFREPGFEHKEDLLTASYAYARGLPVFLEMPNTKPLTTDQSNLNDKLDRASRKYIVNYGFFIGPTAHNLRELQTVEPSCGVKIFMGSMKGDLMINEDEVLESIFANVPRLIAVHADDQNGLPIDREWKCSIYPRKDFCANS